MGNYTDLKHNITVEKNGSASGAIPESPNFTAEIEDSDAGLRGWLVIHSVGRYGSCGGVRLYPDVSREEAAILARVMTYKYCFHNLKFGGAKAVIQMPFDIAAEERVRILEKFGEHIGPLIRAKVYLPWTDMNCSVDDIMHIYNGAGIQDSVRPGNSSYYTALSTHASLVAAAKYFKLSAQQCRVTIEGLGNVGRYLAAEIGRWGGKIVAASTRVGGVVNLNGLNIEKIIENAKEFGDFWVKQEGEWDCVARDELFSVPMDIHVPCARIHSISGDVGKVLGCKVVVPAANCPCTIEGKKEVRSKGIKLLPDFVVSSGGIVGPGLSRLGCLDNDIRQLFLTDFRQMIDRLLRLSDERQTSCLELARAQAQKNYRSLWLSGREKPRQRKDIFKILKQKVRSRRKSAAQRRLSEIRRILGDRFVLDI